MEQKVALHQGSSLFSGECVCEHFMQESTKLSRNLRPCLEMLLQVNELWYVIKIILLCVSFEQVESSKGIN